MNKFRFTIQMLAVATFLFAAASMAQAQATRTWVSGVGDDVNPCSRTAPCKTFAGAISKTADKGEIDCLDPGGFGTVTITKNITIDGTQGAGFGSILAAGTNGVNVNDIATATPHTIIVALRNLSIQGAGSGFTGINFTSGKAVHVENCIIANFRGNGGNSHGIFVNNTVDGGQLFVKDTIIRDNSGSGIRTQTSVGTVSVAIDNSRLQRNQDGYVAINNSHAQITNSQFTQNNGVGVSVQASAGNVINIEQSNMDLNTTGLFVGGGTTRIGGNNIFANTSNGIQCSPTNPLSFGENRVEGNGTDTNGCSNPLPQLGKK
jgi:hypothetical protein